MKTLSLLPLAPLRAGLVALLLSLAPALPASPGAAAGTIRVIAGLMVPLTDETGARWLPSGDFPDGEAVDRPELRIANTDIPSVYRSERYGMTRFVRKIPNGNYVVKLHFAVTYEAIVGPGQCVFTFDVEGLRSFREGRRRPEGPRRVHPGDGQRRRARYPVHGTGR
jgi:hypothetical protein